MKKLKTALCVLLCALLSMLLSACRLTPLSAHLNTQTTAAETSATASAAQTDADIYSGRVFTLRMPWAEKLLPDDTAAGEELRQVLDGITDALGAEIEISDCSGIVDYLTSAKAGEVFADVVGLRGSEIPPAARAKLVYATDDPMVVSAGLNRYDKTCWDNTFASLASYNSKLYTLQLFSKYDLPEFGSLLLSNTSRLHALGIGNVYNLIGTGKWTAEQLRLFSVRISVTGLAVTDPRAMLISLGGSVVTENGGSWRCELSSVNTVKAAESLMTLRSDECGGFRGTAKEGLELFNSGKLLFLQIRSSDLLELGGVSGLENSCAVLPVPSAVSGEYVNTLPQYRGYAISAQNPELEKSVAVFCALAAGLRCDWVGEYLKQTGIGEGSRETVEKYLLPGTYYDKTEYEWNLVSAMESAFFPDIDAGERTAEVICTSAAEKLDAEIAAMSAAEAGK